MYQCNVNDADCTSKLNGVDFNNFNVYKYKSIIKFCNSELSNSAVSQAEKGDTMDMYLSGNFMLKI